MTDTVQLPGGVLMPILYEDRSVLAIDKPAGWMLAPGDWQRTRRNLQLALESALAERPFWVRSRGLRFLRYVHRLDAETTGILLLVKNRGAVDAFSRLFESRQVTKTYLAVVSGSLPAKDWTRHDKLAPDESQPGRMRVDRRGKDAETRFSVLECGEGSKNRGFSLIQARPITGRTHQIRVHLAKSGCPVVGDKVYGGRTHRRLGLRAVRLSYVDPFRHKPVDIQAPVGEFLREFGWEETVV